MNTVLAPLHTAEPRVGIRWALHDWRERVRTLLLAGLPVVILLSSPNRVLLSICFSVGYIAFVFIDRAPIRAWPVPQYVAAIALFLALQLLAAETVNATSQAQRTYGLEKTAYFLTAVLPLCLAVTLMIRKVGDLKAIAWGFAGFGAILAIATIVLRDPGLLGYGRYTWLGNLCVIAALVFVQSWLVPRAWPMAALTILCVVGALLANSRQSFVALTAGLLGTAIFWFAADLRRRGAAADSRRGARWPFPLLLGLSVPALTYGWTAVSTQGALRRLGVPDAKFCECVAARLQNFGAQPGGRIDLLKGGLSLFQSHPILGAGLGSFTKLHLGYAYPHNVVLELAGETGLIGVLLILGPIAIATVRLVSRGVSTASRPVSTMLAIFLTWATAASFSGDLASERGFWLFGLIALRLAWPGTGGFARSAQGTDQVEVLEAPHGAGAGFQFLQRWVGRHPLRDRAEPR